MSEIIVDSVKSLILNILDNLNIPDRMINPMYFIILTAFVILVCAALELFGRWVILSLLYRITKHSKRLIFSLFKKHRLLSRIIHLVSPLIISIFSSAFGKAESWVSHAVTIYVIILLIVILDAALSIIDDIYRTHEVSKKRPIKSFLQVIEIIIVIVFVIVVVSSWINENPIVLLSGIGAFAAVISIIFKDSILGFVAGIQLTADDMIRIGDWIEMPRFAVDGIVTDISLISVRVENFDNTTTSVPAYALVSDSFKNWRSMKLSGSRRIKRAIYIDMSSITFCSEEMLTSFAKIEYLKSYINEKQKEFERNRSKQGPDISSVSRRQKLTNIGVFRIYLERYLANLPKIREDMTILVRQLPAENRGLPMEICAFTSETEWIQYENVQSDIFDHIYAVAPAFGLRLFQEPTGYDMHKGM